jgi:hypothetical protein
MTFGTHVFGLLNVLQAGLEPAAVVVAVAAHLFSQCNVALRNFHWARGSGCQSFDSPWCFISAKCGSSISAMFWSHGAHTVWFHNLIIIFQVYLLL